MLIWNVVLTAMIGLMSYVIKDKFEELNRLTVLLNKTREEVARDHITRAEVRADMERMLNHVDVRFNRIEEKLDNINK